MSWQKVHVLVLTAVVVALVASCAPRATPTPTPVPTPTTPLVTEPIKIGVYLPLSGPGSFSGELTKNGFDFAHKQRPTVLGRPVEVVVCDERTDKAEGIACMSRLIERDKVVGVLGTVYSSICIAAGEVNEKAHIPAISPTSTNPLTTKDREYYFRAVCLDDDMGSAAATYAVDVLKADTAAILLEVTNDAHVAQAAAFRETWAALGKDPAKIVADLTYRGGDEDFTSQVTILSQKDPDVLFHSGQPLPAILTAQQAHSMGLYPTFVGTDAWDTPELVEIGGEDVEGFVMTSHYHPKMVDSPEATEFVAAYQAEYGRLPAGFEAVAFDSYNMMLRAIEDAGTPDPELMRDALEAMVDFPGVSGPITPGPSHNPKKALALLKVENGELVYVYTAEPVD